MWKTGDGTYLNDFYNKIFSLQAKDETWKQCNNPLLLTR